MTGAWQGVFPAATTQFRPDQSLDIPATMDHLDRMIEAGIHGLIMLGTVGENCSLEYAEKLEVFRAAVEHVARRVPVLSGVAEYTTDTGLPVCRRCQKIGVDGLMVLPAMVYKSDPRETMTHFRAVARSTSLPIMVYNNPVSYRVDITPEMFAELADEASLVAIKESSENVRRITDLKNVCGDRYDALLRGRRPGAGEHSTGRLRLGFGPGQCVSRREPPAVGPGRRRAAGRRRGRSIAGTRRSCTWTLTSSWSSTSSWRSRNAGSARRWSAPRDLPLIGEERERILAIIRRGIATRPPATTQVRTTLKSSDAAC